MAPVDGREHINRVQEQEEEGRAVGMQIPARFRRAVRMAVTPVETAAPQLCAGTGWAAGLGDGDVPVEPSCH